MTRPKLRPLIVAAFLAVTALTVAACGSGDGGDTTTDASASSAGPVTIETAAGPVTLDAPPKRIVAVGSQWGETMIALGVTPVGYYDSVKVSTKQRAGWLEGKVEDSKELDPSKDLLTQIADLNPDLILAETSWTVDAAQLKKLKDTGIPVIGNLSKDNVDSWQSLLEAGGKILGKEQEAADIKASIDQQVADIKAANPGLDGKTYTFCAFQTPTQITVLADETDGAANLFYSLGLSFPQKQLDEAKKAGTPRFPASTENIQILDSDLLIISTTNDELKAKLPTLPGYDTLTSVKNDGIIHMEYPDVFGLNTPSALSVPFVLEKITPALEAVGK